MDLAPMTGHPQVPVITGTTRLFAVLGDPVNQVRVPTLLNPLFAELGIDAVVVPVHVRPHHLAAVVGGLQRLENLDGILITVPHKVSVCAFADEVSESVAIAGSANAMRRNADGTWLAENFDGAGFVTGLQRSGHSPQGWQVSLIGAGGAGSAIAVALLNAGVAHLSIYDTDGEKLAALLARLAPRWPGRVAAAAAPRLTGIDLIVNATPLGLRPEDPLPFEPRAVPANCLVADIIMKPSETRLLKTAATLGRPIHPGIAMLESQIALYQSFFGLSGLRKVRDPLLSAAS